ncbi:MAG: glycerol-3-phosphate 1-O-acyltransferase PlsY [bacterium]
MNFLVALVCGYLIGALPTGVIVCRLVRGTDPRSVGSGSMGATNVTRILGRKWGGFVLALDVLKGYVPVAFITPALMEPERVQLGMVLVGAAAVIGHVWTIFGHFRGGKGVGTMTGVLLALDASSVLICLGVWLILFVAFRLVSLASLAAAVAFPVLIWLSGSRSFELKIASLFFVLFIFYTHRQNIARLLAGKELPPGQKGQPCA